MMSAQLSRWLSVRLKSCEVPGVILPSQLTSATTEAWSAVRRMLTPFVSYGEYERLRGA